MEGDDAGLYSASHQLVSVYPLFILLRKESTTLDIDTVLFRFIGALLAGYSTAVCHPIAPPNTLAHACKDRTSKGLVFLPIA